MSVKHWFVTPDTTGVQVTPRSSRQFYLSEDQLKAMVKAINDKRREDQRRDLKMPDGWPDGDIQGGPINTGGCV